MDNRPERDLARAAITAENVNLVAGLGRIAGVVGALLIWWALVYPRFDEDPILTFVLFLVLPYVGLFVGGRVALMLLRG